MKRLLAIAGALGAALGATGIEGVVEGVAGRSERRLREPPQPQLRGPRLADDDRTRRAQAFDEVVVAAGGAARVAAGADAPTDRAVVAIADSVVRGGTVSYRKS